MFGGTDEMSAATGIANVRLTLGVRCVAGDAALNEAAKSPAERKRKDCIASAISAREVGARGTKRR